MAVDWSCLPLDLVSTIALKLGSFKDFVYFSAVCHSWNRASSLIKHQWKATPELPWLLLAENTNENPNCVRKIINLENNKYYKFNLPETFRARCWGSAYGWVAMVDPDLNAQLFNPITKARIPFPSVKPFYPNTDKSIKNHEDYIRWFLSFFLIRLIVLKVSPHEFAVVVLYDWRMHLAFARQGDRSWTKVFGPDTKARMVDVASIDENVFALYNDGSVVSWNFKEVGGCEFVVPINYCPNQDEIFEELNKGIRKIYLVRSGRELLMVLRYKDDVVNADETDYDYDFVYRTVCFDVYRLNPKDRKWEEIQDFGDVVLVVGNNSSMCVPVTSSKNMQRSCIYFTDDESNRWGSSQEKSGHDMGFCDIKFPEKIWKFYEGGDTGSLRCPPTFFIPQF